MVDRPSTSFEERLNAGIYDEIFGQLKPVIARASAEYGVDNEIGVLRIAMAKLLAEESDPFRLATGVARLSSVIVQAQKAAKVLSGEVADDITGAIATILEEMQA